MLSHQKINHFNIYFFALCLMIVALPLSKFLMSISLFVLAGNWLWEGHFKEKFHKFFHNKAALVLCSFFILHVIGLIYTSDFSYAFKDLRTKLPLLILPLILCTTKCLNKKRFTQLMLLFVAAVISGTFISTYIFIKNQFIDIRDISVFISHIRFSLLICISVFTLLYFILKDSNTTHKIISGLALCWLVFFLFFILASITGTSILIVTAICLTIYFILKRQTKISIKLTLLSISLLASVVIFIFVNNVIKKNVKINPVDFSNLEKYTSYGNLYYNDTTNHSFENGNYVWIYVSEKELREAWNKRSHIDFNGKDKKGQKLKYTLIRFLTSKAERKDADGISKLTDKEISSVEKGIPNVKLQNKFSIKSRIYETIWDYNNYKNNGNPSKHSVAQRFEFWKTSTCIIKANFWFGVGTGDMNIAFEEQYAKMHSRLEKKYQLRSHNQYLSIFVGFGLIGFVWFIFFLIYPPVVTKKMFDYFYFVFFIIAILSMLTEDTIESQTGVMFFAFFNSLFLFAKEGNN